jgi:hypothetical protein
MMPPKKLSFVENSKLEVMVINVIMYVLTRKVQKVKL